MKNNSWEGAITRYYEKQLGLHGGYARRIRPREKSSIANSEYIKSDDLGLKVVARSGHRINPTPTSYHPHFHNYYGNEKGADAIYKGSIKKRFDSKISALKRKVK